MSQDDQWTATDLLARYRDGDQRAAQILFERYVERLTVLARARLSPRMAGRTDPEDVVLSAWRSFFIGIRSGRFTLQRSADLWRLLVSITMHKLYRHVRHHSAQKRAVGSERSLDPAEEAWLTSAEHEPTPDEAMALVEELEVVMAQLGPFARRVLELRLQGEQLGAIAAETGRSERTVRRILAQIRQRLSDRLGIKKT
jgi:RNA polymerase sigma factor (sigma-70 family)